MLVRTAFVTSRRPAFTPVRPAIVESRATVPFVGLQWVPMDASSKPHVKKGVSGVGGMSRG
jgi:hypothetical protein